MLRLLQTNVCSTYAGNEIANEDGEAVLPPEPIKAAMVEAIGGHTEALLQNAQLDGKRPFLISSAFTRDRELSLCRKDGPHEIKDPRLWFGEYPGIDGEYQPVGFNAETGNVGLPVVESLRKFMSEATLAAFPRKFEGGDGSGANEVWDYHKYIPHHDNASSNNYGTPVDYVHQLGEPASIEDFAEQAQIVAYQQYRALLEGYTARMWTSYTVSCLHQAHPSQLISQFPFRSNFRY